MELFNKIFGKKNPDHTQPTGPQQEDVANEFNVEVKAEVERLKAELAAAFAKCAQSAQEIHQSSSPIAEKQIGYAREEQQFFSNPLENLLQQDVYAYIPPSWCSETYSSFIEHLQRRQLLAHLQDVQVELISNHIDINNLVELVKGDELFAIMARLTPSPSFGKKGGYKAAGIFLPEDEPIDRGPWDSQSTGEVLDPSFANPLVDQPPSSWHLELTRVVQQAGVSAENIYALVNELRKGQVIEEEISLTLRVIEKSHERALPTTKTSISDYELFLSDDGQAVVEQVLMIAAFGGIVDKGLSNKMRYLYALFGGRDSEFRTIYKDILFAAQSILGFQGDFLVGNFSAVGINRLRVRLVEISQRLAPFKQVAKEEKYPAATDWLNYTQEIIDKACAVFANATDPEL